MWKPTDPAFAIDSEGNQVPTGTTWEELGDDWQTMRDVTREAWNKAKGPNPLGYLVLAWFLWKKVLA